MNSQYTQLQEQYKATCACSRQYDDVHPPSQPRILPCSHPCCSQCLISLCFRCRICNKQYTYQASNEVQLNFQIIQNIINSKRQPQLLDAQLNQLSLSIPSSSAGPGAANFLSCCDEKCGKSAIIHCENCNHDYCQVHSDEDHSTARLKQHKLVPLPPPPPDLSQFQVCVGQLAKQALILAEEEKGKKKDRL